MPDYDIATGTDDFYSSAISGSSPTYYYTTTTLLFGINNFVFPSNTQIAYGNIDTSAIPTGDTITAATFHWYHHSYTASKRVTKSFNIWMKKADESGFSVIYSGTYVNAGWKSHALTASELLEIDKGSGSKTEFRFTTPDPGTFKARTSAIRAYEYSPTNTYDVYLSVTHAPAASWKNYVTICTT